MSKVLFVTALSLSKLDLLMSNSFAEPEAPQGLVPHTTWSQTALPLHLLPQLVPPHLPPFLPGSPPSSCAVYKVLSPQCPPAPLPGITIPSLLEEKETLRLLETSPRVMGPEELSCGQARGPEHLGFDLETVPSEDFFSFLFDSLQYSG